MQACAEDPKHVAWGRASSVTLKVCPGTSSLNHLHFLSNVVSFCPFLMSHIRHSFSRIPAHLLDPFPT
jgi:hypothetical protein